jgi:predicted nucleotidyltransferase
MDKEYAAIIERAAGDPEVLALIFYGSRARGDAVPASDLDVCLVLCAGKYDDLELSKKKLAYLKDFNCDIQLYQQLPLYIRVRVLKEGKIIFCSDEDQLYDLAYRTAQHFEDYKPVYYAYLEEVAHG